MTERISLTPFSIQDLQTQKRMMKVLSSTDVTMKLVLAICYNLLILITELQADDSSKSSESSEENENTAVFWNWSYSYGKGNPDMAGGTAQEEVDEQPENESPQTPSNSYNVESGSTPFTRTDQSSSISVGIVSVTTLENTTPYGKTSEDSDNAGDNDESGDEVDKSNSDGEENETDNEENGEGGVHTSPTVTMVTMISSGSGKRDFFPLQPLSGRPCFVIENPNQPFCQCNSPPPQLPKFPECSHRVSRPGQMKSSRRHGDCDILCICWILAFVGVVVVAVCKVSMNRRTHF